MTNLIGIYTFSVSTDMTEFAENGIYRTVPMVLYKINDSDINCKMIRRPIEIFHEDMDYRNLKNLVGSEDRDISFLSIPGKAFTKMQGYVNQNVYKVIADMVTSIVVQVIASLHESDPDSKTIFFIDNVNTNKLIGRLGNLYLETASNTIAFVTYKSGGLMTDVLNAGSERLSFDINYFNRQENEKRTRSAIIPNDYMESLTQTVFFDVPNAQKKLSPLRCDILSQGISKNETGEKVKQIEKVLKEPDNMTLPFKEETSGGVEGAGSWAMIPKVLADCINAAELYSESAMEVLEKAR